MMLVQMKEFTDQPIIESHSDSQLLANISGDINKDNRARQQLEVVHHRVRTSSRRAGGPLTSGGRQKARILRFQWRALVQALEQRRRGIRVGENNLNAGELIARKGRQCNTGKQGRALALCKMWRKTCVTKVSCRERRSYQKTDVSRQ